MIDILNKINKEKSQIDEELSKEDEKLLFYREFFSNNSCITLNDAISADHCGLATAILLNQCPHLPVKKVKEIIYSNEKIFGEFNQQEIDPIVILIDCLNNHQALYKKIKPLLFDMPSISILGINQMESIIAYEIVAIIKRLDMTPQAFISLVDLFLENIDGVATSLSVVSALRTIAQRRENHYKNISEISQEEGIGLKSKEQDRIVSEMIRDQYDLPGLLKVITTAKAEYFQLEKEKKVKTRNLLKTKAEYERVEAELYKAIQMGEVGNIQSLISKIPSEEIRISILKFVYLHNKEIYEQLTAEYNQLAANDASHYQVLLAKYGISPETYDVGTVMTNSIEELEKMLCIVLNLKLSTPQELLRIAQNSNLETVENIQALAEKGIITAELIKTHQQVLNPDTKEHEDFINNLNLIFDKSLNPHMFKITETILTISHQRFSENIHILENYELQSHLKSGMNLSFLGYSDLNESIDILLELGYERNLEESLELLNHRDKFNRLKVLKALNIPVSSTEELLNVLTADKFYVPDDEISNYIYNATEYNLPQDIIFIDEEETSETELDASVLSRFSNTTRTYSFGGVLISKNRVHNNLSTISSISDINSRLIYSVLKGAVLTEEEVVKVKSSLASENAPKQVK